ncbi:ABC transporter ATP-binding protein [Aquirufa rosea]|uniref:ATP-binding cassette domain-containing protein n=1 Tax=Aquirufa rosea TaxID=2509241 RepID=A0A4Q1BXQ1_9BACT|nr:ATP-binding cassette domain-containing protein [Aquirufa rosea]RXK47145.1 ATP-binding cassette domain-containing protein [Aquirufa rosea]
MSIEVVSLSKIYGNQIAVNSVSFQASEGQIIGFLGPNGAGKSSTLKMLVGLIKPSSGHAKILGLSIAEHSLELASKIGYLAENNPLYPDMYVQEFLDFIGKIHGFPADKRKKRIEEVIELVGLRQERKKKIGELSKGYQQRVGIAQSIFHDPSVLILDEPTSGLDPNQMAEIRTLIQSLSPGKIILFSSHLLTEVESICHRILLISQGNLVADCTLSEAKNYPGGLAAFFKDKTA